MKAKNKIYTQTKHYEPKVDYFPKEKYHWTFQLFIWIAIFSFCFFVFGLVSYFLGFNPINLVINLLKYGI